MSNAPAITPGRAAAMQKLLRPASVMIVGASTDPRKLSGRTTGYLKRLGFAGRVFPVNPSVDEIDGFRTCRHVEDVPVSVDVAVIARPAAEVPEIVERCVARGVHAFVVLSGGFAESGLEGAILQRRLVDICRDSGAVLCGPNGTGLANLADRVALSSMSHLDADFEEGGSVALISNSGSIAAMIYQARPGLFNLVVSTGNEAVLSAGDYMLHALEDPQTRGVVAFIEGIRDAGSLLTAAHRANELGKPLVILKGARTEKAAEVASSHTGALVDDDAVVEAVFERHNILRADTVEELKALALLIHCSEGRRYGKRAGIVTTSGGTAVLMADVIQRCDLELPALAPESVARIKSILPAIEPGNPMDVTGFGADPQRFGDVARAVADDTHIDVVLAPLGGAVGDIALGRARALVALARESSKPIIPIWQSTSRDQPGFDLLQATDLPLFTDYAMAARTVAMLAGHARREPEAVEWRDDARTPEAIAEPVARILQRGRRLVTEPEVKAVLSAAGVGTPRAVSFRTTQEAGEAAAGLAFPAVLKIVSPDIIHKSAVGGVAVVRTAGDMPTAAASMARRVAKHAPEARLEGFLLEEMILGGTEFLVGVKRNRRFGLSISLGLGGTLAETFARVETALLPVTPRAAAKLLRRFAPDWEEKPVEAAFIDLLSRVASLAAALGEQLDVLEINPVRLLSEGDRVELIALDGVIGLSMSDHGKDSSYA